MRVPRIAAGIVPAVLLAAMCLSGCGSSGPEVEILNVSYDPTRELYRKLNRAFAEEYHAEKSVMVRIRQSHGGSGSQARAVMDGLPADVVTLAMWSDTNAIAKKGLIDKDWESRFDNRSLPYYSTIVFVVRKGNPKGIHNWRDLLKPGVQIIGPNPKTSGGAKLNLLAAWGAILKEQGINDTSSPAERAGAEEAARDFVTQMYRHCPILDSGARGATVTFARRMMGDVHLTWENEARLEVDELPDELEIVYPSWSIKAEPHVALVDANVDRKGTRAVAEAYLKFFYQEKAQRIIAQNGFRPTHAAVKAEYFDPHNPKRFPNEISEMQLFGIDYIDVGGWDAAQKRFFADGGLFDQIYQR
jgi:sulfate/thiosulfate transport system substrate-binding protein